MNENIGLFCASSNNMDALYYEEAARFGKWLGEHGKTLIYGGNNRGLMEATARALHENKTDAHSKVMGIVPEILIQRGNISKYIDEAVRCVELNERKKILLEKSDIIVVMPGSIGTLDEAFSVIASNTIGIHNKRLVFWNINGFWSDLFIFFNSLSKKGVVNKPWPEVYSVANTLEELIGFIN